jgi:rubrerythrin
MLDVYVCKYEHEFAVKDGEEPSWCPLCGTDMIEFSHEVIDLEGVSEEEVLQK